jgi:hypothetical protein
MKTPYPLPIRLLLVIALAVALGGIAGVKTVKAQCDSQSGSNQGQRVSHICIFDACAGDQIACEADQCNVNCPQGEIIYCVANEYCGSYITNGCYGRNCT